MREHRIADLFRHFGATSADVRWQLHRLLDIHAREELDYIEETIVYLSRYAHIGMRDVLRMEIPEADRFVCKTRKWVYAEQGRDENGEMRPARDGDNR